MTPYPTPCIIEPATWPGFGVIAIYKQGVWPPPISLALTGNTRVRLQIIERVVEAEEEKFQQTLEDENPLRSLELAEEESRLAAGFGFLTMKPMLYILNLGEDQLPVDQ